MPNKFSILAFAMAGGVLWGIAVLLLGWAAWLSDLGEPMVAMLASIYLGYAPTFIGGFIGGIWGFIDAFIAGAIFAWIYNFVLARRG